MIDIIMYPSVNVACPVDSTMYPSGTGQDTGSINLFVSGGAPPYSFSVLLNGVSYTTQQFYYNGTNWVLPYLAAGTYTITITDSTTPTPQTATVTITLTQPSPLIPNPTITPPQCNSDMGSITLNPTGGTSPYTYLWSNGATSNPLVAVSGVYSVVITDAKGCGYSFDYTIPVVQPPTLEIQQTEESGQIILTALYTCPNGTVFWNTGAETRSIVAQIGNTYIVTLSCSNGANPPCIISESITVTSQDYNYWCCLSGLLNDRITDELNGVTPCDCNDDITLYYLIGVFENSLGCLSASQQTAIISKINSLCCNCGGKPISNVVPNSLILP